MALCGNCGAEGARVRSRWKESQRLPDECPICAPQAFAEKFKSVRDGQITMAYEYDHKRYRTIDGIPQITDEGLADLEAAATKESEDDKIAFEKARAIKRQERRTTPMTPSEIELAAQSIRNRLESTKSLATN